MEKTVKNFSEYLVAAALAVGALTLLAIDAQDAVRCGPNGCYHYYPRRSQWPVGQGGGYYNTTQYHGHYKHRSQWPVGQ
jgi:hypothetical protein